MERTMFVAKFNSMFNLCDLLQQYTIMNGRMPSLISMSDKTYNDYLAILIPEERSSMFMSIPIRIIKKVTEHAYYIGDIRIKSPMFCGCGEEADHVIKEGETIYSSSYCHSCRKKKNN